MNVDPLTACDISVVITAHAEGRLAHRTMRSVQVAIDEAAKQGIRTEIIIVLDNPTQETLEYFARWRETARVLEVMHRDPGLSRNSAVAVALGKYVAIVDADDLFGKDWLRLAYQTAETCQLKDFIVHAEYTVFFEHRKTWTRHQGSHVPGFRQTSLLSDCKWTSLLFAPRATFCRIPFEPTGIEIGFDFEVRHWICNVLATKGDVLIAPGTCEFKRSKSTDSLGASNGSHRALMRPSKLFDPRRCSDASGCAVGNNLSSMPASAESARPVSRFRLLKNRLRSVPAMLSSATEEYPPIQKTLGAIYRTFVPKLSARELLPPWLLKQWREVSNIEPELFPDAAMLSSMEEDASSVDPLQVAFDRICNELGQYHCDIDGKQFTHIYLVPWLKRGGSDLVALKYVLLTSSNPANRVLVIATEDADSPWKVRLPKHVAFLEFGRIGRPLERSKRQELLASLLVQLQADVLHGIYSRLGTQCFIRYGLPLSRVSRLYSPAFCTEVERDGKLVGDVILALPLFQEYLTGVISENQNILTYLEETFAFPRAKLFLHYQPVVLAEKPPHSAVNTTDTFHVLWAGRLDRQKRPDLLLKIATRCQDKNMHFHVYGSSIVAGDKAEVDLSKCPNVTYRGEFDGLASLPTETFDVFLNTSQWDGMPNILLEATAEGLPIISSDVGGIPELIEDGVTGMLVSPFDNIESYVSALVLFKSNPELRRRAVVACRELVNRRHSWEQFATELNRLPGYLNHPCLVERADLSLLELPSANLADVKAEDGTTRGAS